LLGQLFRKFPVTRVPPFPAVGATEGVCACSAATATSTVFASELQAATVLVPVTPPRAKTTTAARMPSTTMTIRSSMRVNPSSTSFARRD